MYDAVAISQEPWQTLLHNWNLLSPQNQISLLSTCRAFGGVAMIRSLMQWQLQLRGCHGPVVECEANGGLVARACSVWRELRFIQSLPASAVVAGSFALHRLLLASGQSPAWEPDDLDVFVDRTQDRSSLLPLQPQNDIVFNPTRCMWGLCCPLEGTVPVFLSLSHGDVCMVHSSGSRCDGKLCTLDRPVRRQGTDLFWQVTPVVEDVQEWEPFPERWLRPCSDVVQHDVVTAVSQFAAQMACQEVVLMPRPGSLYRTQNPPAGSRPSLDQLLAAGHVAAQQARELLPACPKRARLMSELPQMMPLQRPRPYEVLATYYLRMVRVAADHQRSDVLRVNLTCIRSKVGRQQLTTLQILAAFDMRQCAVALRVDERLVPSFVADPCARACAIEGRIMFTDHAFYSNSMASLTSIRREMHRVRKYMNRGFVLP